MGSHSAGVEKQLYEGREHTWADLGNLQLGLSFPTTFSPDQHSEHDYGSRF